MDQSTGSISPGRQVGQVMDLPRQDGAFMSAGRCRSMESSSASSPCLAMSFISVVVKSLPTVAAKWWTAGGSNP